MIIVTGPTGSGKTTTLYSMLNKLKSEETNIVTVEDPIEYKLSGINQVQVNEKQGLGFPNVLRSVLRQDPDIILVGEIRDMETASIAFQAALTGHLVFSTLHTNDTVSTLSRLFDMGVERFKIAPAILAITAQRLVRRLCPDCKKQVSPDESDPQIINLLKGNGHEGRMFKAVGCDKCLFTGYRGRLALLEFLQTTREIRERIGAGADEASIRQLALSQKTLQTMLDDALWHLSCGDTSLEEIRPYVSSDDKGNDGNVVPGEQGRTNRDANLNTVSSPKGGVFSGLQNPSMPATRGGPQKVLIADDDPVIRMTLRAMMEKSGFQVIEAEDGQSALQLVQIAPPHLLLLDLNMPQMDGHEVIRYLKEDPVNSGIPIIVLTSEADEKNQEKTLNAGADDYIVKPLKPALVLARVNAALRRKQA